MVLTSINFVLKNIRMHLERLQPNEQFPRRKADSLVSDWRRVKGQDLAVVGSCADLKWVALSSSCSFISGHGKCPHWSTFKLFFAAKRQRHKQCAACSPCLQRSVNERGNKELAGRPVLDLFSAAPFVAWGERESFLPQKQPMNIILVEVLTHTD